MLFCKTVWMTFRFIQIAWKKTAQVLQYENSFSVPWEWTYMLLRHALFTHACTSYMSNNILNKYQKELKLQAPIRYQHHLIVTSQFQYIITVRPHQHHGNSTVCLTHWGRDKMAAIFADDMFKCIFLNENVWISIEISLKFVPKGSINKNPALFQIMAWRHPGDKLLSEPMMVNSLTHICVTRPQWVNWLFRLAPKQTSKLGITGPLWRESTVTSWFLSQRGSNAESVSMSCHHEA